MMCYAFSLLKGALRLISLPAEQRTLPVYNEARTDASTAQCMLQHALAEIEAWVAKPPTAAKVPLSAPRARVWHEISKAVVALCTFHIISQRKEAMFSQKVTPLIWGSSCVQTAQAINARCKDKCAEAAAVALTDALWTPFWAESAE